MVADISLRPFFMPNFSVVLYTNNNLPDRILHAALWSVRQQLDSPDQLIIVGHKRIDHDLTKGALQIVYTPNGPYNKNIYCQLLMGLEISRYEYCFCMEHDVLYPNTYFQECIDNHKDGAVNYANQIWLLNSIGYWTYKPSTFQSTAYGKRDIMIEAVHRKLTAISHDYNTNHPVFDLARGTGEQHFEYANTNPVLDIRHRTNTTPTGTARKQQTIHQSIPYWGKAVYWIQRLGLEYDHQIVHSDNPPND